MRTTLVEGFGFVEGPRWHDGRLVFSDMGTRQVLAVDLDGKVEEVCVVDGRPSGIGRLPDGRMLVVSVGDKTPIVPAFNSPSKPIRRHPELTASG